MKVWAHICVLEVRVSDGELQEKFEHSGLHNFPLSKEMFES